MVNLFFFIIGACLGSFLNVVIYRVPKHLSIVFPGSHCPNCKKSIPIWANIPICGFFLTNRRCYYCKSAISWRYPLVELAVALLFLGIGILVF